MSNVRLLYAFEDTATRPLEVGIRIQVSIPEGEDKVLYVRTRNGKEAQEVSREALGLELSYQKGVREDEAKRLGRFTSKEEKARLNEEIAQINTALAILKEDAPPS